MASWTRQQIPDHGALVLLWEVPAGSPLAEFTKIAAIFCDGVGLKKIDGEQK
jgi:hypothetical protein